jgi:hypothetical protein
VSLFDNIKALINKNEKSGEIKNEEFEKTFKLSILYLEKFHNEGNTDILLLKESAKLFAKSISIKRNSAESYFYLSYIFFLMDQDRVSLKYLKVCRNLNPSLEGIKKMQDLFNSFIYESNSKKAPEINNKAKLITKIERLDKSRFSATEFTKDFNKNSNRPENELSKNGVGILEYNNDIKSKTTLGLKIQKVTRINQI